MAEARATITEQFGGNVVFERYADLTGSDPYQVCITITQGGPGGGRTLAWVNEEALVQAVEQIRSAHREEV